MVDKISQAPSNYTTPRLPEVGVSAPIDQGADWASLIKTIGGVYGGVKTEQFMKEQQNLSEGLKYEYGQDKTVQDISKARYILEQKAAGTISPEDEATLKSIMSGYESMQDMVAQGVKSQRRFELEAAAKLRESIKRRPDLTKELNELYSAAVGTPSLDMLQHRYFTADMNYIADAAKAKSGPSEADVSRRIGDLIQIGKVLDADDAQVVNAVVSNATAALIDPNRGAAEAAILLGDPGLQGVLSRGVGDAASEYIRITQGTADFQGAVGRLSTLSANTMPDSPEWQNALTGMNAAEQAIRSENIALSKLNYPAAKAKIEQNNSDLELIQQVRAKADDPIKVNALLNGFKELRARQIPEDASRIISSFLSDFSKESIAPISASFEAGHLARRNGSHRQGLYTPSKPESFNLFTRQLSINPRGEKMSDTEKAGAALTLSGLLADWGYPITDSAGRLVPRSMEDYFDPRQGVLVSLATAIPALDNTYMTQETWRNSPEVFKSNLYLIGGVIDQANLSVYKRLSYEGLDSFVKRGTVMELARTGRPINWDSTLQIVGNPNEQQRQRLNEILTMAKSRTTPITNAYDRYIKLRN